MENVKLDVTFLDDTRISVEVAQSAAAAAAAERAAKKSKTTPVTYAVHLTGNVEHDYEVTDAPNGASSSDDELDASGSYGPESSSEDESSESSADDTAVNDDAGSDSESWGSGSDLEDEDDTESPARVARESSLAGHGSKGIDGSEHEEVDAEARRNAATTGAASGQWATPDPKDEAALGRWDASASTSEWAYHIQNSGARQHRRSSTMPEFKWTGPLRPQKVSPKRSVPKVGWLCPLPDYARTGWPETEFASSLQHKLEVKTPEQMAKMRVACSLGRAVMDAVAAAIAPGVTTDFLDRICHAMTLNERRVPVPAELHGLPKVTLHVSERGGVPRDPRRPAVGRWRHRQPGHNRVPQRVPRRFKRDVFCRDRDVRPGAR